MSPVQSNRMFSACHPSLTFLSSAPIILSSSSPILCTLNNITGTHKKRLAQCRSRRKRCTRLRMMSDNHGTERQDNHHVLIFGMGYVGQRLSRHLHSIDDDDKTSEFLSRKLVSVTAIVSTVPPGEHGNDPVLPILRPLLASSNRAPMLKLIIYLSSTSVYGTPSDPEIPITENYIPDVTSIKSPKSRIRFRVESEWLKLGRRDNENQFFVSVFRLAGVYGPGLNRSLLLRTRKKKRNDKNSNNHVLTCRIHVDDLVTAIGVAVLSKNNTRREQFPTIINVADDLPASRVTVEAYAHEIRKEYDIKEESAMQNKNENDNSVVAVTSFRAQYRSNKKISNSLLKSTLLPNLKYPTFREGLRAIAEEFICRQVDQSD